MTDDFTRSPNRRAFLKSAGVATLGSCGVTPAAAFAGVAVNSDDYARMDATALAAALRARRISPAEALAEAVKRHEAVAGDLNYMSEPLYAAADARLGRLDRAAPFAGVPFLMKAEEEIAGTRKNYGSRLDRILPVSRDNGPFAAAIERAGFVTFGRTTMSEFGALPTTETLAYGVTRNP